MVDEQTRLKVRENRMRRAVARQGLFLSKSTRRDPRAVDYGCWYIIDPHSEQIIAGDQSRLSSLEDVERWVMRQPRSSRAPMNTHGVEPWVMRQPRSRSAPMDA
jgi:hypothetical protein